MLARKTVNNEEVFQIRQSPMNFQINLSFNNIK